MNFWIVLLAITGIVFAFILVVSVLYGAILLAAGRQHIKNERKKDGEKILANLPHTDCKECGMDTCAVYAQTVAETQDFSVQCPYMSPQFQMEMVADFAQRKEILEQRKAVDRKQRKRNVFLNRERDVKGECLAEEEQETWQ